MTLPILIIGAGHAGVQVATSLRDDGFTGPIQMIEQEQALPYQRPPLSKAFMKGEAEADGIVLKGADFYAAKNIDLMRGEQVTAIERTSAHVRLTSGKTLPYSQLVLATGAIPRPFAVKGSDLSGVHVLRGLEDATNLREQLKSAQNIVIIGAGFIGLEFAAVAAHLGKSVHVVELGPRVMGRAVTPALSAFFESEHRAHGVVFSLQTGVSELQGEGGHVTHLVLSNGDMRPADLVLVGIGILPNDSLAREAGLACSNGIEVDEVLRTSDANISALGDCALYPNVWIGTPMRLESVQNAVDQARCLSARLVGRPSPYTALPWFWSDQGDLKLQMVGFASSGDTFVTRGAPDSKNFSIFGFKNGTLCGVDSVNRAGDHMAARRIMALKRELTPEQAGDESFDLKTLAKG